MTSLLAGCVGRYTRVQVVLEWLFTITFIVCLLSFNLLFLARSRGYK